MNYYIQGNKEKADQIKAAFEAKGCVMHTGNQCDLSDMIYFSLNGKVGSMKLRNLDLFKTHPDYKELELPKPHYNISNFKAFDKVLTRDTERGNWNVNLFSYYIDDKDERVIARFRCINSLWKQCIPFEGNEHLLGTTDMCDEEYINW